MRRKKKRYYDRDLGRRLCQAGRGTIPLDREKKEAVIAAVLEREVPMRKICSFWEFLLAQLRFLNRMVVLGQALWLGLFLWAVWMGEGFFWENGSLCILSMAPPLLLLLAVDEIARVYNRSMLEIEYTTKYSLTEVVLSRLLISGTANGAVLFVGILLARSRSEVALLKTLVYSFTPLVLMTCLLLRLMKHWKGESLKYVSVCCYVFLVMVILVGRMRPWNIYQENCLGAWLILLLGGIVGCIWQLHSMLRRLGSFEQLAEPTGL